MNTPRFQHVRFFKLNDREDFFYGKFRYTKTGFFTGRTVLDGELVVVMPWRKVRSTRLFGKVNPRPPVPVTPGGDRTPETIGGSELTPSS